MFPMFFLGIVPGQSYFRHFFLCSESKIQTFDITVVGHHAYHCDKPNIGFRLLVLAVKPDVYLDYC